MKYLKVILPLAFVFVVSGIFSQTDSDNSITTKWETITIGKLQKKPVFKEPMIAVRFIAEDGSEYIHIALKYMFTDAVFEDAVPVEYYKNEKIVLSTDKGKHELRATRYSKARRMNTVAQKTADIKVIFSGDLSFLAQNPVQSFTVHYAQGYQNIKLNEKEAMHLKDCYNKFLAVLPKQVEEKPKPTQKPQIKIYDEVPEAKTDTVQPVRNSLDKLRKNARQWGK